VAIIKEAFSLKFQCLGKVHVALDVLGELELFFQDLLRAGTPPQKSEDLTMRAQGLDHRWCAILQFAIVLDRFFPGAERGYISSLTCEHLGKTVRSERCPFLVM